jgi:cyclohexa-1,5-dienecarbonyl-CoA hydratase
MQKIKIEYTHDNSVAQITLDDGKGNVLDSVMMGELNELLNSFKDKTELKLITFEGAGKHFCFGASVEEHTKENAPAMLKSFHQLFYTITDLAIPTLAKISGQCLGGGLELALICNFLFADKSANLGQPEILLGVFPPPASVILPEGKAIGLINKVFEDKDTMEKSIEEWIKKNILNKSASSLRYVVRASRTTFNHLLRKMLPAVEEMYLKELMETDDANEGINSFLEKRKPIWKNS